MHFTATDVLDLHKNDEYYEEYESRDYDYPHPIYGIPKLISLIRYEYWLYKLL